MKEFEYTLLKIFILGFLIICVIYIIKRRPIFDPVSYYHTFTFL